MSTPYESFGKYILLEKLATGGMAEVFLARGTGAGGIGKFFAVKRILPQYADSPEFIEMFKDEAKIAINLSHSNIVSIHEFGVEKGQFFLVMDYVEGRNLRQILNKMKKSALQFSLDQIVFIVKEVAAGLDHAHRCIDGSTGKPLNITHRDMSPQNLMVSFEGEVKIVDFGIAKAESQIETTRAGTLKGKFGYMSPEQAEGQPVDLRTDIFSLGIVAWELLANDRLFVANNEINTLRKIRDCQIPALRKINPNIHPELERIAQKALARDRNLRYQTGAALHRDLNRFLNRQYPDFSTQDFAVFIKSVFADEILSLRKRLVEYTKVKLDAATSPKTNFDETTSLLNTDTNSLVISNTDSEVEEPVAPQESKQNAPNDDNGDAGENTAFSTTTPSSPSLELSMRLNQTKTHDLPPTMAREKNGPVLDQNAIEADMKRLLANPNNKNVMLEPTEITSPSIRRPSRIPNRPHNRIRPPSSNAKPARLATFLVFALMCVSVYAYLVKYFTPLMSDVIAVTDPYLHGLHAALDVDIHSTDLTSNPTPAAVVAPIPAALTAAAPHPAAQVDLPAPAKVAGDDDTMTSVVVTSNPSGAEVLINDRSTGLFTPTRVEIPNEKFDITIRKRGFIDSKMRDVTKDTIGHRIVANLVKRNVAYLDIDVLPPQDVLIYINGKLLASQQGPIRELPVLANTPLKVRVETRNLTAYDEITVTIPVDKRQIIQLNPHKPLRFPSSSPPNL